MNSLPQAVQTATAGTIPSHLVTRIFLLGIFFFRSCSSVLRFCSAVLPFHWLTFALVPVALVPVALVPCCTSRSCAGSVPRRRLSHRFPEGVFGEIVRPGGGGCGLRSWPPVCVILPFCARRRSQTQYHERIRNLFGHISQPLRTQITDPWLVQS